MDTTALTKPELIVSWICRVVAAIILLQTLFFNSPAMVRGAACFATLCRA